MNFVILILFVSIVFQGASQVLVWTYWWQKKEYRFDRFKTVFSSPSRKKELEILLISLKIVALILSLIIWPFLVFYFLIVIYADARYLLRFINRSIRKPVFTQRAQKMLLTVLVMSFASILFGTLIRGLLFFEISLLLGPYIGILFTKPAVEKARVIDTKKALEILIKINPKIIGITGSYGKSTTKEFVAQLLSSKYKTLSTCKNQNTDFGIARRIINDMKSDTQIFVTEIGAYKKGEIRRVTEFVKPSVAVITGIEGQHLELFGSVENIMDAKFELVQALPAGGIAIFNVTGARVEKLARRAEKLGKNIKVLRYGNGKEVDMETRIVKTMTEGITFQVREKGQKWIELFAPVFGAHFVENLSGAILVARKVGVKWSQIQKIVAKIQLPDGTMNVKTHGKVVYIDDSYNSTPKGFLAAIDYLSLYKNFRKIVVTPGIIELGDQTEVIHKLVSEKLRDIGIHTLFLTNADFYKLFANGLKGSDVQVQILKSNKQLIDRSDNETAILIEGRVPDNLVKT